MSASYCKITADTWGLALAERAHPPGETVTVVTRAGKVKRETIGQYVGPSRYGTHLFAIAPAPARAAQNVGDLSRIIAMFDRARQHLRFPAVVLDGLRVNVAGQRAREPGSLTITSPEKGADGRRAWLGRVTQ